MSFEEKNIDDRVFDISMLARDFLNVACDEIDLKRANMGQTPIGFSSVHLEPLSTRVTYYVGDKVGRVSVQQRSKCAFCDDYKSSRAFYLG